jgi:putative transposase
MQYRRANIKGGTYFFTVNLAERNLHLLVEYVAILRDAVKVVKHRHPFHIDAFVVLPDHLHALWTLPDGDADFATRWMLIKAGFSRQLPVVEKINSSRSKKGERGIWQRRYWEHMIRDDFDFQKHVDYIHYNPVKHGHSTQASDWPYSSIHRYITAGLLKHEWGGVVDGGDDNGYGER